MAKITAAVNGISEFVTTDSGAREEYPSGAVRDTQAGKGRFDLLPYRALRRVAQLYERGAAKYGDRNWEKGISFSRCFSSMLRHAFQALAGETDEDHLAAVVFNAFCLIEFQERGRTDLDDSTPTTTTTPSPDVKPYWESLPDSYEPDPVFRSEALFCAVCRGIRKVEHRVLFRSGGIGVVCLTCDNHFVRP
jgi:hypothetical protein